MGLIKKPSDLDPKYNLAALIYGQPGIGKKTLALSAPEPVCLPTSQTHGACLISL